MIDRDKVIEGLQYLHDRETWKEGITIFDDHASDRRRITQCALELLKEQACEQRARILTAEEVRPNELVYIEVPLSDEICPAFLVEKDWFEHRAWRTTGCGGCHSFLHDGYGRDWRCWSANPTDEQRRAVKWK